MERINVMSDEIEPAVVPAEVLPHGGRGHRLDDHRDDRSPGSGWTCVIATPRAYVAAWIPAGCDVLITLD